jgi:hypothetical protein
MSKANATRVVDAVERFYRDHGWTREVLARDGDNARCDALAREACSFCFMGALCRLHGTSMSSGLPIDVDDAVRSLEVGLQHTITYANDSAPDASALIASLRSAIERLMPGEP